MKTALLSVTFALVAAAAPPDFNGAWRLLGSSGAIAPEGLIVTIRQTASSIDFHSQWEEPKSGQYGLTLLGIITPDFRIAAAAQEDLNQVGPFVFRSRSRWEGNRLITAWNTSDFNSQSFHGTWTRYLSADGRQMTLEIAAVSSPGKASRATLLFKRE
jgi:hypothetical protein